MNNNIQNQQQMQKPAQGASSKAGREIDRELVVVGTRVRCALPYCGDGVVFAIHGVQAPENVRSLFDSVGVTGGNARFDVVFSNGAMSLQLAEAIVRGIQWTIFDEVVDEAEIRRLLENSAQVKTAKERSALDAATAFAAEVERLKTAPELAHLKQGDDRYSGKLAAANLRAELRRAFPKTKFSVRKPHYGSVGATWTDGPTEAEVAAIANRYKGGHFDGMADIYVNEKTPFIVVFGGADYVSTHREYSDELVERAIVRVFERYAGNLAETPRPSVADFRSGQLYRVEVADLWDNLQSLIRKELGGLQQHDEPAAPVEVHEVAALAQDDSPVDPEAAIVSDPIESAAKLIEQMDTEPKPRPLNWYEQKLADRRERLEERAASLTDEGNRVYAKARQMASVIPFGQPILVGHHSESRDRNYRARIHSTYGKSFALQDKAAHYERKAASVGTGGISSDDPDAIAKLQEQVEQLEKDQELMKAANKAIRKHKTPDAKMAALVALGFSDKAAIETITPDFCGRVGFPSYVFSNNNGNIRRIKQRIQELETNRALESVEVAGNGYTYREDTDENRVMFVFQGKPAEAVRTLLKNHAFKWSPNRGAWVRKLNSAELDALGG
ncbi:hypothetical protein D9M68_283480 [compost metagenome]